MVFYCGIGFDRSRTTSDLIETDEGKGIFSWDKTSVIDCLARSTKPSNTTRDRQLSMVTFLFELGYDLMILLSTKFLMYLVCLSGFETAGRILYEKDN